MIADVFWIRSAAKCCKRVKDKQYKLNSIFYIYIGEVTHANYMI